MAYEEAIGKIDKVNGMSNSITTLQERMMELRQRQTLPANKEYFESLMRQEESKVAQADVQQDGLAMRPSPMDEAVKVNQPPSTMEALKIETTEQREKLASPMEEAAKLHSGDKITPLERAPVTELIAETKEATQKIRALKEDLNRPDLNLKPSVQQLMGRKLNGVDANLKVAMNKSGLEHAPAAEAIEGVTNPVERFLGMLGHSQGQLEKVGSYFEYVKENGQELSPASVLTLQIKMHHITTELEFFTSLLNKSLEGTKTVMQVQV